MQSFDSNGPDVRVRGNANQVYEKYLALARDASSAGDRVIAESYYQHAEHYYRIMSESTDPWPDGQDRPGRGERPSAQAGDDGGSERRGPGRGDGHAKAEAASRDGGDAPGQPDAGPEQTGGDRGGGRHRGNGRDDGAAGEGAQSEGSESDDSGKPASA